jgi:hypothetical protein
MKICTQCRILKPLDQFGRKAKSRDGRRSECSACNATRTRRAYVRSSKVGTTVEGVCAHCAQPFAYTYRSGRERMYCSELCRCKVIEARRTTRGLVIPRACPCGSRDVARVGKPVCPACKTDRRDPELARAKERRRTLRKYGLTTSSFDRLVSQQGGRCAICRTDQPGGRGEQWHIDHCHSTNEVRGLLCHSCNVALGHFRDDPQLMKRAMAYLSKERPDLRSVEGTIEMNKVSLWGSSDARTRSRFS